MNYKYRKKPVVIEAFQMTKERREDNVDWPGWLHQAWNLGSHEPGSLYPYVRGDNLRLLAIMTLEGEHQISWGDFIIRGVKGELYPCKPDIFAMTYDPECDCDFVTIEGNVTKHQNGCSLAEHARKQFQDMMKNSVPLDLGDS